MSLYLRCKSIIKRVSDDELNKIINVVDDKNETKNQV